VDKNLTVVDVNHCFRKYFKFYVESAHETLAPSSSYILLIDKLSVANKLVGIYFCKIYTKEPIEKKVNILYFY